MGDMSTESALYWLDDTVKNLRELSDLEEQFVRKAREVGASWAEIAAVYGVTRQAAHARWAKKEKTWKTI